MQTQSLSDILLHHTVNPQGGGVIQSYSPEEIRLACQELIAGGHNSLAIAVGEAAYSLYPESTDILAITSLMAAMEQDWQLTIDRLLELIQLQGVEAQEFTYELLARAQRCNLDYLGALATVLAGLRKYPASTSLLTHLAEIGPHLASFSADADLGAEAH